MHRRRNPHSLLRTEKGAQIVWLSRSAARKASEAGTDAVRVHDLRLSGREERRIVEAAERMLAAAGSSADPAARERAQNLVDTVCRLAALLHRLSATV